MSIPEQTEITTFKELTTRIRAELSSYIELRVKLLRVEVQEKGSIALAAVAHLLMVALIALLTVIFALGLLVTVIYLLTDSLLIGMVAVTMLMLIGLVLVWSFGKSIRSSLTNTIIGILDKLETENNE